MDEDAAMLLERYEGAFEQEEANLGTAIRVYEDIIKYENYSEDAIKAKESSVYRLGAIYSEKKCVPLTC